MDVRDLNNREEGGGSSPGLTGGCSLDNIMYTHDRAGERQWSPGLQYGAGCHGPPRPDLHVFLCYSATFFLGGMLTYDFETSYDFSGRMTLTKVCESRFKPSSAG